MEIQQADRDTDIDAVRALLLEYLQWTTENFTSLDGKKVAIKTMFDHSMADLALFFPPDGALLIATCNANAVGIGFLKKIRPDACEIKRMYLRPEARGSGLGKKLLLAMISRARKLDCNQLLLDSGRFMHQAHGLYRSVGFVEIPRYPESEMAEALDQHLVYMALRLE